VIVSDTFIYSITDGGAPIYTDLSNNASDPKVGSDVMWSVNLTDDTEMSTYRFDTNDTGTWVNGTGVSISGATVFVNYNYTLTATRGQTICGRFSFNDTSLNNNITSNSCLTVVNTLPVLGVPEINDTMPSIWSFVNCDPGAYNDADSDAEQTASRQWLWFVNGTDTGFTTQTMYVGGNMSFGDTAICRERTYDGYNYSNYMNSTEINLTYDGILAVNAYNAITGFNESNFTINTGDGREFITTTNISYIPVTIGVNISLTIEVEGLAETTDYVVPDIEFDTYEFELYGYNSISITLYLEGGTPVTENINATFTQNVTTLNYASTLTSLYVSNLTTGEWNIEFFKTGYIVPTSYDITVANNSHQFLDVYLSNSTDETTFTITDSLDGTPIDAVSTSMYRSINETWVVVSSKYSDVTGKVVFAYTPLVDYRFYLSRSNYTDKIFTLSPILFSEYSITMIPSTLPINWSVDFEGLSLIYAPSMFYNDEVNTFNWLLSSPHGTLIEYGFKLTTPGWGENTTSGSNAIGGQLTMNITPSTTDVFDTVRLDYYYRTSLSGLRNFTILLPIIMEGNNTFMGNQDETYGLGIFERILIAYYYIICDGYCFNGGSTTTWYGVIIVYIWLYGYDRLRAIVGNTPKCICGTILCIMEVRRLLMGNLTTATTFIVLLNILMWFVSIGMVAVNPDATVIFNPDDSLIGDSTTNLSIVDTDVMVQLPEPSASSSVFTDIFNSVLTWVKGAPRYVYGVVAAPANILSVMNLPREFAVGIGVLWYMVTFLVLVGFLWGRN